MNLARWTVALTLSAIGSPGAAKQLDPRVGTASYDCAPWDGLALRLELPVATRPPQLLNLALYPAQSLRAGQRYEVQVQGGVGQADAWFSGARAQAGSVWLDRFVDGKGATGRFALTLADGSALQGRFSARWKNPAPRFLCG